MRCKVYLPLQPGQPAIITGWLTTPGEFDSTTGRVTPHRVTPYYPHARRRRNKRIIRWTFVVSEVGQVTP